MISFEQYQEANQALLVAKGFYASAAMIRTCERDALRLFTYYCYPYTVNAAIACELFIKLLLILQSGSCPSIHSLNKLFHNLSSATRKKIESLYQMQNCSMTLDVCLSTYDDSCVAWRYIFDKQYRNRSLTMAWTDLMVLNGSLCEISEESLNSLSKYFDNGPEVPNHAD